jgi:DNA helicase-2/ATP-dependent DNA helicase PcrA
MSEQPGVGVRPVPADPARPGLPGGARPLALLGRSARSQPTDLPVQLTLTGEAEPVDPGPATGDGDALPTDVAPWPRLTREGLRDLLGVPYTEEQLAAICAPAEPGVIVAGAGSGKTSVMAARVVWLVGHEQVPAESILGLTFTRKAAAELNDRIGAALARLRRSGADQAIVVPDTHNGPDLDSAPNLDGGPDLDGAVALGGGGYADAVGEPAVSTYNSFASRLVADHALRLGLEPDCALLPAAARYQLAANVARGYPGGIEAFTGSLAALVSAVVALDGQCGEHLVDPAELIAFDRRWLADVLAALDEAAARPKTATLTADLRRLARTARRRIELAGLVVEYREARRRRELLDYGDQIRLAAELAERVPEVGGLLRRQFRVVLLDEYQDTSVAQRRLLAGLFGGGHPVTAVGDPAQAIYGWRGASVGNLRLFPDHFRRLGGEPAQVHQLTVNQRSGGRLLTLANAVAAGLPVDARSVTLRPRPAVALAGETIVALHTSWAEEAAWIAGQLAARLRAASPGDPREPGPSCAVLARSWADVPTLVDALGAAGLPVEVLGLGGLLTKPEIADIRAMLEVLDDPTANPAMTRLLSGPRLRLGPRDLAALGRRAAELARSGLPGRPRAVTAPADPLAEAVADVDPSDVVSLADALAEPGEEVSAEATRRLRAFAGELAELRGHLGAGLVELVHRVVETTGLDVELELAAPRGGRGRENLAAFLRVAADFERSAAGFDDASGRASLTSFLGFLSAGEQYERGLDADVPGTGRAVQVLTMHGSKGLEWDVVAVPNISRTAFPDAQPGDRWITTPEILPTPLRGDAAELPVFEVAADRAAFDRFASECREQAEQEERRLAYVAFTRARWTLVASGHWWGPTQKRPRGPSPFLLELAEHATGDGNGRVDHWADTPLAKTNPSLETPPVFTWPAPLNPVEHAARRDAADAVRVLLASASAAASAAAARAAGASPAGGAESTAGDVNGDLGGAPGAPEDPSARDDRAGMTAQERALLAELDQETRLLLDEQLTARAPARLVALPTGLTATQVMKLRADPDGLARELVRPMPRRPVPAASRGIRFHAWVEEVFERRPLLDHEDLPGAEDEYLDDTELRALKDAFLTGPYGARQPYAVEAPFELPLGGRVVRGRIDAVYDLGAGRYEVVDWKTGSTPADPVQLALYRLAWSRLCRIPPEEVNAAFYYVLTSRVVRPELLTEAQLIELLGGGGAGAGPAR